MSVMSEHCGIRDQHNLLVPKKAIKIYTKLLVHVWSLVTHEAPFLCWSIIANSKSTLQPSHDVGPRDCELIRLRWKNMFVVVQIQVNRSTQVIPCPTNQKRISSFVPNYPSPCAQVYKKKRYLRKKGNNMHFAEESLGHPSMVFGYEWNQTIILYEVLN